MDKRRLIEKNQSGKEEEAGYSGSIRSQPTEILEGIQNPFQRSQKLSRSPSKESKQLLVLSNKDVQPSKPPAKHVYTSHTEQKMSTDVDANAALMNAHKINMQQDNIITKLEERIKMLEKELEDFKIKAYCSSSASHELKEQLTQNLVTDKIDYETDENQLAADTDPNWIVKTSNKFSKSKKRKLNNTLTPPNQQQQ